MRVIYHGKGVADAQIGIGNGLSFRVHKDKYFRFVNGYARINNIDCKSTMSSNPHLLYEEVTNAGSLAAKIFYTLNVNNTIICTNPQRISMCKFAT